MLLQKAGKLEALPSHGDGFTWGGRRGNLWIQSRLDRCFGNRAWSQKFPCSNQLFMAKTGSDHRPVLIKLIEPQESYRGCFRFDRRLLDLEGIKDSVTDAWQVEVGSRMGTVSSRLKACRKALSTLKKRSNMNSRERIRQLEFDLEQQQSSHDPSVYQIHALKKDLVKAYRDEEIYWWQKSNEKWMYAGDRNTKFFQNSVKAVRAKNNIEKLLNDRGEEVFSEAAKGDVAIDFFSKLFKSSNPKPFDSWFQGMAPRVTDQMNWFLNKPVTAEEVKEAVFSINPSKAPGPDGMSALFFQKFWSVVKEQVVNDVQRFFISGVLPKEWNYTHLCLIPKIPDPKLISDLRPISLCSVIYKVVSKIIVARLKPWMNRLVGTTQSAFVSERLLSYNITIAHELVHSLGSSARIGEEYMVVKTDMSKAYDRVEWGYLRALLCALGFQINWVNRIMTCVSTVSYSILINDQPHGLVVPQRGLRQGDPLSPFLFVLCAEGLSHLLMKAEEEGSITGMSFGDHGPSVKHLLFADDCLLVCKANEEQSDHLLRVLHRYGEVTGQVINPTKSSITFGKGITEEVKSNVRRKMGIEAEGGASKYLGLPESLKGSKVKPFAYLKERMLSRISGWHAKTLSQGGKEVLLKSTASALPVSAMSCFKIPKTLCDNLSSAMASFWWSSLDHKRKIHWISWEKMCLPKEQGGMGFKDLECFNQALLAKQAWRLIHSDDCLMSRVTKAKYFENVDFATAPLGAKPSYAWRSILYGRDLLSKGLKRMVGNGRSLKVWTDPWLEDEEGTCRPPIRRQRVFDVNLMVSDLINPQTRRWDTIKLNELFVPADIAILLRNQPVVSDDDSWLWKHTRNGLYSVRTGYDLAFSVKNKAIINQQNIQPSLNPLKAQVWGFKVLTRVFKTMQSW